MAQSRPPRLPGASKPRKSTSGSGKTKSSRKRAKPQKSRLERGLRGTIGGFFNVIWLITSRTALVLALIVGAGVIYYYNQLPPFEELLDGREGGSVTMYDASGDLFATRGEQYGGSKMASDVSQNLIDAIVAVEDKRFYWHPGVDPIGIVGAMRINMREGRSPLDGHGGSSLTAQVTKLVFFDRSATIERKIKEVPAAMAMEVKYSKEEILSIYLNRVYLGAGLYGAEAAAQRYFGKSAAELSVAEAAMIAGLLKAPSSLAPTSNLDAAQDRATVVLNAMRDQDYITDAEFEDARQNPATLSAAAQRRAGGYFADWVMEAGPDFLTRNTTEDVQINTTFSPTIQRQAEEALNYIFETKVKAGSEAQAAIVVMSRNGAVRAIVGGRDAPNLPGQFNRATQAKRQTGSAFKPFVYAVALDQGMSPNNVIQDAPLNIRVGGKIYNPKNYGGGYRGTVTLQQALASSINTSAVRLAQDVGTDNVAALAHAFGVQEEIDRGPAMALGTSEMTLMELTAAYAGFLNGGVSAVPYGIEEVRLRGDSTPIMGASGGEGQRVISQEAAGQLVYMLHEVVENGTGRRARIEGREVAGKTGTTQGARDAWFVGFTADYVVGVWMGYDRNETLTGVTGGGLPAEIWHEAMVRISENRPARPLPMIAPLAPKQTEEQKIATKRQQKAAQKAQQKAAQKRQNQGQVIPADQVAEQIGNEIKGAVDGLLNQILGGGQ
ncbi:transglycosylase domain-containing protein [Paracoccaceae bacterium GXU_MW_L88]